MHVYLAQAQCLKQKKKIRKYIPVIRDVFSCVLESIFNHICVVVVTCS